MFLTPVELVELTGTPRRTRQIQWLRDRGWAYEINYRGRPVVAREEVQRRLVGGAPERVESAIRWDKAA